MHPELDGHRKRLTELRGKVALLQPYMKSGQLTAVTPTNAAQFLEWSSAGYGVASLYYAWTLELYKKIDTQLDFTRSIAFLDKAEDAIGGEGKKTAAAKTQYVSKDPDVILALDMRAEAEALTAFYKSKAQEFRMNHEAIKKIAYADNYGTAGEL